MNGLKLFKLIMERVEIVKNGQISTRFWKMLPELGIISFNRSL